MSHWNHWNHGNITQKKNQENPFARQTLFRAQSTISDKSAGKQAFRHPSPQCCYHLRWLLSLKGKTPFVSLTKKPSFICPESRGKGQEIYDVWRLMADIHSAWILQNEISQSDWWELQESWGWLKELEKNVVDIWKLVFKWTRDAYSEKDSVLAIMTMQLFPW